MTEAEIRLHHLAHDLGEVKGRANVDLMAIDQLLADAADAIEIGEAGIAARRIAAARERIAGARRRLFPEEKP